MKKLMTAMAICAAASYTLAAGSVTSANVVGYSTIPVKGNNFTMLAINFEAIGAGGSVSIQTCFTGTFTGGPSMGESDNLITWSAVNGYKWHYYGYWGDPSYPEWDNKWYNSDDSESTDMLAAGSACWLLRRGTATNIVQAGQVKSSSTVVNVSANGFTMFGSPYPTAIALSQIVAANATGGPSMGESDNLITWTAADGYKWHYYGYWGDPSYPEWDNKWYNSDDSETSDVIPVGGAAWYVRRGAATTITFNSPL